MANRLSVIEAREPTFEKLAKLLFSCSVARGCEGCIQFPNCIRAWDEFIANFAVKRESSFKRRYQEHQDGHHNR